MLLLLGVPTNSPWGRNLACIGREAESSQGGCSPHSVRGWTGCPGSPLIDRTAETKAAVCSTRLVCGGIPVHPSFLLSVTHWGLRIPSDIAL